ncbi:hypothetical protein PI124_g18722 [Phytophthora idaei]|nr:hypothetical protein PI125_g21217 [Phytophthora idaei]KAG3236268.1 hypothetical protein PI124_g18722 [Phytophthora idaei]
MPYTGYGCPKYRGGTAGLHGVAVYGVSGDAPRESMSIRAPRPRTEANRLQFMGGVVGTLARTLFPLSPIFLSSLDCDSSSLSTLPASPRMRSSSSDALSPPSAVVGVVTVAPFVSHRGALIFGVVRHTDPFVNWSVSSQVCRRKYLRHGNGHWAQDL